MDDDFSQFVVKKIDRIAVNAGEFGGSAGGHTSNKKLGQLLRLPRTETTTLDFHTLKHIVPPIFKQLSMPAPNKISAFTRFLFKILQLPNKSKETGFASGGKNAIIVDALHNGLFRLNTQ
jgi:hypothetical protein